MLKAEVVWELVTVEHADAIFVYNCLGSIRVSRRAFDGLGSSCVVIGRHHIPHLKGQQDLCPPANPGPFTPRFPPPCIEYFYMAIICGQCRHVGSVGNRRPDIGVSRTHPLYVARDERYQAFL